MREAEIERRLVKAVEKRGGLCYKFVSPANPGVPDRVIILPGGQVLWVELKTEIGHLAAIQRWQIQRMRERGADVRVVKGLDAVHNLLKEIDTHGVQTS